MSPNHPRAVIPAVACMLLACLGQAGVSAQPLDCMIQPHQVLLVGSAVPGVVEKVNVERGDTVRRGQVLVQLQADVERAAVMVARERIAQRGEYQAANGARELARRELSRSTELYNEKFISRTVVDKAEAEVAVADGRTEQAQERRRLAHRELALAEAQLAQRTVRAGVDGVVVDRLVSPGEFVEQKPLLRLATIDPLRVDVLVPAAAFGRVRAGQQATVVPELFNGTPRSAVVSTVDRVIDAASNTFRVRLELPNPDGSLPAGLRCKVDLGLPSAADSSANSSAVAPAATASPAKAPPAGALPGGASPAMAPARVPAPRAVTGTQAPPPRRDEDGRVALADPASRTETPRRPTPARPDATAPSKTDPALVERLMRALAAATPPQAALPGR